MGLRGVWAIGIALLLAGCTGLPVGEARSAAPSKPMSTGPMPTPTLGPTTTLGPTPTEPPRTPSADCVNPPLDIDSLIYQTDRVACYGAAEITVEASVGAIGAIDCNTSLEPAWFRCFAWVSLGPLNWGEGSLLTSATDASADGQQLARSSPAGPEYHGLPVWAVIHPASGLRRDELLGRSLTITGHFDDPAAQTCHYTDGSDPEETRRIVEDCRSIFVITGAQAITGT
jgi:hypothetical protein